ncbi:MAG: PBP1A family penicillin-binding protein [Acetobacteraceae bacterium]|nr:PBP1A family penicillin-binding protein [Acetobacteraceae bacterium]
MGRLLRLAIILAIWGLVALGAIVVWAAYDLPRPESAMDAPRRPALVVQDWSGQTIATYGDLMGEPLRVADLPPELPAALVAVEDRRFWKHWGLDVIGLTRAVWVDVTTGRLAQGGSSITQQVAKTLFLTNERTFRRKIRELLLTIWLERTFTKREILEIYLNRVYLGAGTWGMDAAARMYFGISARKVNLWQAAVLAGLPRAPSRFNPRSNPSAATARAKEVLTAMADTGVISQDRAKAEGAKIAFPRATRQSGAWFADWASDQVQAVLPPDRDATIRTTLDLRLQIAAETALTSMLDGPGVAANVEQGAVIVLDAVTGAVRAMAGGRDYRDSNFNRAVNAHRQPGSAFKPFVWLTALENGMTPADTIVDAPVRVGSWQPENFEHDYRGEITLDEALAHSVNTVSVRLMQRFGGPKPVAATAARLGITSRLPKDASLALGTGEVGLLELTAAFAPFFNGGFRLAPFAVVARAAPEPVIRPEHAAMMAGMMSSVVSRGTGKAAAPPGRPAAGKTGTTSDYRDAWFVGYVNGMMIGVWMGNDDNAPMKNVTGGSLPARVFREVAAVLR